MKRRGSTFTEHGGEQNYLVSVGDIVSGLLFLFIITLVLFSLRLRDSEENVLEQLALLQEQNRVLSEKMDALEQEKLELEREKEGIEREREQLKEEKLRLEEILKTLTGGEAIREMMLKEIATKLELRGISVQFDLEHGILRLPDDVLFPSGSAGLQTQGRIILEVLAEVMKDVLPNYTGENRVPGLPEELQPATVEAIFIEGHTDNVPMGLSAVYETNWELSAARAITTYRAIIDFQPSLLELLNENNENLFSVAGYADSRPTAPNVDDDGRKKNRRIDLRFIMSPPKVTPQAIEYIRDGLYNATNN